MGEGGEKKGVNWRVGGVKRWALEMALKMALTMDETQQRC